LASAAAGGSNRSRVVEERVVGLLEDDEVMLQPRLRERRLGGGAGRTDARVEPR
jgi:hypothetical protein